MPIRVTFRVKRESFLPVNAERAKKQRTTNVPCTRIKSEIVNTAVEVIRVKTDEVDGSNACDHGASESALCEPSSDPYLSHNASTSSSTSSKQRTSQGGSSDDNAQVFAFEGRLEGDSIDSRISNQDSESPAVMYGIFSELQREEELEYEEVAPRSTAHGTSAAPFITTKKGKKKYSSWDERFNDLVDFKAINGHTIVVRSYGPLGRWVRNQRTQYRLLKEGKPSPLSNERCNILESIGFVFQCLSNRTPWDQRFQELVDFKKVNGHTNVPTKSGPLGRWVDNQRTQYRLLKEGKPSPLSNERCDKLESIGFVFRSRINNNAPWDQRFQELVDFKKVNGHTNVPQRSGPLGTWVQNQRAQYRFLTNERQEKLDSIGFYDNIHKKS